jgi:hypothetical protein
MTESIPFRWHKSSYSGETNGCLEIRTPPRAGKTRIRDSKDPFGPVLICTTESWNSFVLAVLRRESDGRLLDSSHRPTSRSGA